METFFLGGIPIDMCLPWIWPPANEGLVWNPLLNM